MKKCNLNSWRRINLGLRMNNSISSLRTLFTQTLRFRRPLPIIKVCSNPAVKHKRAEYSAQCGLVLKGTQVKSLRAKMCDLSSSFCDASATRGKRFSLIMHRCILPVWRNLVHDPYLPIRLLGKSKELGTMVEFQTKGYDILPIQIYFNENGFAKVLVGCFEPPPKPDKRAALDKKDQQRERKDFDS